MITRVLWVFIGLLIHSILLADDKLDVYFFSEMYAQSETAPINQIVREDFEGSSFDGGERSFTHNVWEMGSKFRGLKFAALARYDYYLEYTEDVAELVYADRNDLPIETNREYDLFLDAYHLRSHGFKVGYEHSFQNKLIVGADVSYLRLRSYVDGQIIGNVEVGEDSYDGFISLDYVYSKDLLLDRITPRPKGDGYAADVYFSWQVSDALSLSAKSYDILGEIKVDRSPFTSADANSNRVDLGIDGRIDVKPVLTGQEGYRAHTLKFPRRHFFHADYQLSESLSLGATLRKYTFDRYVSIRLQKSVGQHELSGAYDFKTEAVSLGIKTDVLSFSITTDRLKWKKARTFGLGFAYRLGF